MHRADSFLELSRKYFNKDVSNEVVEETREVRLRIKSKAEIEEYDPPVKRRPKFINKLRRREIALERLDVLKKKDASLYRKEYNLRKECDYLKDRIKQLKVRNCFEADDSLYVEFLEVEDELKYVLDNYRSVTKEKEKVAEEIKYMEMRVRKYE